MLEHLTLSRTRCKSKSLKLTGRYRRGRQWREELASAAAAPLEDQGPPRLAFVQSRDRPHVSRGERQPECILLCAVVVCCCWDQCEVLLELSSLQARRYDSHTALYIPLEHELCDRGAIASCNSCQLWVLCG